MPGLTQRQNEDDGERDHTRLKERRSHHRGYARTPRVADSQYDSDSVVSHRMPTGYGVNEPQWTEGPPPVIFHLSPYARVPLPFLTPSPVALHPLLTPTGPAFIIWTICQNPASAACSSGLSFREQYHWKSLPATDMPNLSSLTIIVKPFLTPIVVLPERGTMITVYDVLCAVYASVRRAASELFAACTPLPARTIFDSPNPPFMFMETRTRAERDDDELCGHVRSYMGFQTRWVGLEPSPNERDVWILRTKPLYQR